MNGLLVHREPSNKPLERITDKLGDNLVPCESFKRFHIWRRPHSKEFLDFVFGKFDVIPWSSARKMNLDDILSAVLEEKYKDKIVDTLHQDHCLAAGQHPDNHHKPLFIKELQIIYDKHPQYSPRNTLMIDDSKYKAALNVPYSAIHPKAWKPYMTNDDELAPHGKIHGYLTALAAASKCPDFEGVSSFVRDKPFPCGRSEQDLAKEDQLFDHATSVLFKK